MELFTHNLMTWSVLDIYIHSASHLHQTSMLYETTVARVAKCLYMMEHFYRLGRSGFFVDTISSFSTHEMLVHVYVNIVCHQLVAVTAVHKLLMLTD